MLENINNILNVGEVPNLFAAEERSYFRISEREFYEIKRKIIESN